ncbi:hypothetical protein TNIN_495631 [Trichonephila inaurata madagascariensis]|uniref:Uncharacterized protein n=1 Tax=Trichonephila inaurata madagascariensis TaxID=2747483 RepID=A0A8X6XPL8_9ARAC|nr:hypothetical protein TNIN_495631 [Trichonephila inaurata madagascariensis]
MHKFQANGTLSGCSNTGSGNGALTDVIQNRSTQGLQLTNVLGSAPLVALVTFIIQVQFDIFSPKVSNVGIVPLVGYSFYNIVLKLYRFEVTQDREPNLLAHHRSK